MNYSVIFQYSNRERKFARSSTAAFDKRSCIYLDHKECVALADFKRNEIEELQKQYELLDSE